MNPKRRWIIGLGVVMGVLPTPVPSRVSNNAAAGQPCIHVVRQGESPSRIAGRYGITRRALLTANHLDDRAALPSGHRLEVPGCTRSSAGRLKFIWPVQGSVSSRFGRRGLAGWHSGVDIKARAGTPIHASAPGTVLFSGWQSSYGRVIKITHPDGFSTVYAHNQRNFVKAGDRVNAGTVIGTVGRTGHASANHLHFEVRRQELAQNPVPLLARRAPAVVWAKHGDSG